MNRNHRRITTLVASGALGCLLAAPPREATAAPSPAAEAPITKAQCIETNTRGQNLRREGKLAAAREAFRSCAVPACPGLVSSDCTTRLNEIEEVQPTVVFDAKDGEGHDLSAVQVTVDGAPLADKLDGTALPLEPGEHEIVFRTADQPPVAKKIVVREGEKQRHESVVLGAASALSAPASAAPPAGDAEASTPEKGKTIPLRLIGVVAGGVGVAGIAVGSVFGLMAASGISQQKTDCASPTSCARYSAALSDHSRWTTDATVSTVSFIAGGVLLAGGVVLFLLGRRPAEPSADATALVIAPTFGPGVGGLTLRGAF